MKASIRPRTLFDPAIKNPLRFSQRISKHKNIGRELVFSADVWYNGTKKSSLSEGALGCAQP